MRQIERQTNDHQRRQHQEEHLSNNQRRCSLRHRRGQRTSPNCGPPDEARQRVALPINPLRDDHDEQRFAPMARRRRRAPKRLVAVNQQEPGLCHGLPQASVTRRACDVQPPPPLAAAPRLGHALPMTDWLRGAVISQIYPRSFRDSNSDGVGDLKGAIEKLDHVAALGCDAVWLSPFFASPMKDYGYDVSDYCAVDPLFGTLADADALIARAHALGLKVILDQVWSHSSDRHAWFAESRSSRDNAKADWYVWADARPDGSPPNNWQAMFGGCAWTWDARRRQYFLHNFLPEQPDLNVHNPAVQDALLDAGRFWLERGVDGFRLDVVNFLTHDAQLRDNPALAPKRAPPRPHQFQRHLYDRTQPETL